MEVDVIYKFTYNDKNYDEYDEEREWNFNTLEEAMEIVNEKKENKKRYKKLKLRKMTVTREVEDLEI